MRLSSFAVSFGVAVLGCAAISTWSSDARACGGCFHPPNENGDVITDHRMIFRVSQKATTLYDEIEYSGSPQGFAWVLPIHGPVTVGLSSDRVFSVLDARTSVTIAPPELPPCPVANCGCFAEHAGGADASVAFDAGAAADSGVNVISQQVVGPYDTVQLQSTNPTALSDWLTANGYSIPAEVEPVIAAYVNEGFDFLAMKLAPGQGVQAMRPVRVTFPGATLSLPLRMVAAGTGATVGITLWVLGDGTYEPQNFQTFTIAPADLVWDWTAGRSNYTDLRAQKEASLGDAAWQIESALDLLGYDIESSVLGYDASKDYESIPGPDAGGDAGGGGETAEQVRADDLATLFPDGLGSTRVTRMRADLSHAALATDLVLQASTSITTLSNDYPVEQSVHAPACPPVQPCNCGGEGDTGGTGVAQGNGPAAGLFSARGQGGGGGCNAAGRGPDAKGDSADAVTLALGALAIASVLARARARRRGSARSGVLRSK
jgi:hypothetical protein